VGESKQFLIAAALCLAAAGIAIKVAIGKRHRALADELRVESARRELGEEELKDAYRHLRNLGRHLIALQEEERGKIAVRIHDELGQALTALSLDVAWIESHLAEVPPKVQERLAEMKTVIRDSIETVRRLATELKPRILEEGGLVAAMEWQVRESCARAGLDGSFTADVQDPKSLLPDLVAAMFRNLQELLANVTRHAEARTVTVALEEKQGELVLTVTDDGRGFDPGMLTADSSFGFLQVRDRARYWGGTVEVLSEAGRGATVEVRLVIERI
jgi:signal transduction histidine kinase